MTGPARFAPPLAGAVLLLGYALLVADGYALRLLALAGINALLALGYQFVFGLAGALSLAQAAFFGIGAYAAALLAVHSGWGLAATLPAGMLAAALVAAVVALPLGRLGSHYFALATLGVAQLVTLAAVNFEGVTGGANGIAGIPGLDLPGWRVPRGLGTAALVWAVLAIACLVFARWRAGLGDAAWRTLRETPRAAAAAGLDGGRMRLAAFVASAVCAAAAGVLQAHVVGVVSPDMMGLGTMVACLAAVVIGGRGSAGGAVIGALLLTHLPEWFRFLEQYAIAAYGIGLLLAVVLLPEGLAGLAGRTGPRRPAAQDAVAADLPPPVRPAAPPLRLSGVSKRFGGVVAADDVSLALAPGEAVGLIGPNGAGKTTLLNLASGFVAPDAGEVRVGGLDVTGLPPHRIARLGLARTFQTSELPGAVTAVEAVALAAPRGDGDAARLARARAVLAALGLADVADRPCAALPPGPRRLVEIARALVAAPAVVLLDEPAAGLDETEAERLAALLRSLGAAGGPALLIVEHDMRFLGRVATRLVCCDQGRIVADGPTGAVLADPAVRALYLGPAHAA